MQMEKGACDAGSEQPNLTGEGIRIGHQKPQPIDVVTGNVEGSLPARPAVSEIEVELAESAV